MRSNAPNTQNLNLDIADLVLPANLISDETLSSDEEVESLPSFSIDTFCASCHAALRLFVQSSNETVRALQRLFLEDLSVLCTTCGRERARHGRR
ncbi:E7 [Macaca mulatta papillomavirus 4]|uniref:Protein E7 n=1 Tax=Macaca mulatta papillomavirus 4 TaxID=2294152 RepID=A0A385AH94_9PAPI|nr:E7 [Macaca mulatta papillomavirus 4]AXN57295.1 E7 [Macaca mulatta papillomavirus 4]